MEVLIFKFVSITKDRAKVVTSSGI